MSSLPQGLAEPIREALAGLGDRSPVRDARPVGGGCIHHATRLETGAGRYFLKWNARPLPGAFAAEAYGLELMRATGAVKVPAVLAVAEAAPGRPAYILLEWLENDGRGSREEGMARLGEQLAEMHRRGVPPSEAPAYGLTRDNYIGSTPQPNGWEADWVTFFRERRLRPQMELAQANGRLPAERRERLEMLIERLDELIGRHSVQPALLHGDLWGGNVLHAAGGVLALIDPAVYYGDREAELAFTELFGGFSRAFYQAYQATWPLDAGYRERCDLYNLYHLLNHLNLFGEEYGFQVDDVLRRYGGRALG